MYGAKAALIFRDLYKQCVCAFLLARIYTFTQAVLFESTFTCVILPKYQWASFSRKMWTALRFKNTLWIRCRLSLRTFFKNKFREKLRRYFGEWGPVLSCGERGGQYVQIYSKHPLRLQLLSFNQAKHQQIFLVSSLHPKNRLCSSDLNIFVHLQLQMEWS